MIDKQVQVRILNPPLMDIFAKNNSDECQGYSNREGQRSLNFTGRILHVGIHFHLEQLCEQNGSSGKVWLGSPMLLSVLLVIAAFHCSSVVEKDMRHIKRELKKVKPHW